MTTRLAECATKPGLGVSSSIGVGPCDGCKRSWPGRTAIVIGDQVTVLLLCDRCTTSLRRQLVLRAAGLPFSNEALDISQIRRRNVAERDYWLDQLVLEVDRIRAENTKLQLLVDGFTTVAKAAGAAT